jgi:peptidoglycan/LPS O-acetylase OafA/YrhL
MNVMRLAHEQVPGKDTVSALPATKGYVSEVDALRALRRLPLARPIGRISYGAYIYHLPVLVLYSFLWPAHSGTFSLTYSLTKFAIGYPVTLLVAYLSFRYFEKPILSLRSRFA